MTLYRYLSILIVAIFAAACGGPAPEVGNTATQNTNAASSAPADPLAATTPTPAPMKNDAPTLTPVYLAYCEAMEKKDEAAVRAAYSSDTVKFFEQEAKADGIAFMEYLFDDEASSKLCEVRNEEITGDTAVAEIRSASIKSWIRIVFVKEGGEWKLTNRSPDIQKK